MEVVVKGLMKGIIEYSDLFLVFIDYCGYDCFLIVDVSLIMVMDGDMVKVIVWYDNEWGYS